MPSWRLLKHIETKLQTTFFDLFLFSEQFLKENISLVILYQLTRFHCLVAFTSWDIGQYVYCNCHEFCSEAYFSNQAHFPTWPKSHNKILSILRTKRAFKMKLKAFFIIFNGVSMKQITKTVLEDDCPTLKFTFNFCHWENCHKNQVHG